MIVRKHLDGVLHIHVIKQLVQLGIENYDLNMVNIFNKEFKGKGANMILGPGLNLLRTPLNGRTFEYISGEDPILG